MLAFTGDQDAKDAGVQILGFSSTSQKEEGHGVAKKAESDVLLQVSSLKKEILEVCDYFWICKVSPLHKSVAGI